MIMKRWTIAFLTVIWVTTSPAHAEPLRIFYFDWAGYGPLLLAKEKGFDAGEGVEVELIPVAESYAAYAGLFSGHVDAVAAAFQDIPFFATPEEHLVCILALSEPVGMDRIVAHESIEMVADLKGKTVAFEEGSSTQFYLHVARRDAGLSQSDVEALEIPDSDAVTAFRLGEVDAISSFGGIEASKAPQAHLLSDSSKHPGIIVDCLTTTPQHLDEHKQAFEALGRAWDAAVELVEANSEEAIEIMAARMGGAHRDPQVLAEALKQVYFYDSQRNIEYFGTPEQPGAIYDTAQVAIDVWREAGVLEFELRPEDMIRHDVWDD